MRVLVIGSGGREHAIVWKVIQSPDASEVFCVPGNPGIARIAKCVSLKPTDLHGLLEFAKSGKIDLTVVGPELPLAEGIVDLFEESGLTIFGPTKRAAELEWSKAFAKDFMMRHTIPSARHRTFLREDSNDLRRYVEMCELPIVLKADGLAAGKGVLVCNTRAEATEAADSLVRGTFGSAGNRVVVEEFMEGEEASVFAISDGSHFVTLMPAQDHKRVFDGDKGKNTGGMGSYAPAPVVTAEILRTVQESIIEPTLLGMAEEGRPYKGCLYVGLMITKDGPKVVEYNCRFGDPETQVVLPLYHGDVLALLYAASKGDVSGLPQRTPLGDRGSAACVVLVSAGYPDEYEIGKRINGLEKVEEMNDVVAFHAGTGLRDDALVTTGGRVLGITAISNDGDLAKTIARAYEAVHGVSFDGMHYRRDIGAKALGHAMRPA
jgi:phosphoribosylamine--glycine ligase